MAARPTSAWPAASGTTSLAGSMNQTPTPMNSASGSSLIEVAMATTRAAMPTPAMLSAASAANQAISAAARTGPVANAGITVPSTSVIAAAMPPAAATAAAQLSTPVRNPQ